MRYMNVEVMMPSRESTKKEFIENLLSRLCIKYTDRYTFEMRWLTCINGVRLEKIIAIDSEKKDIFALSVEELYEIYKSIGADKTFHKIVYHIEKIEAFYSADNLINNEMNILRPWIINKRKNENLLNQCPHKEFGQYVIVYRRTPVFDEIQLNYGLVTWEDMDRYILNMEQLHAIAKRNIDVISTNEVRCTGNYCMEPVVDFSYKEANRWKHYAIREITRNCSNDSILCDELLKKVGTMIGENYYLFPSSVHEWIVVSVNLPTNRNLENMINEINQTLMPDDVLGNQYFLYDVSLNRYTAVN